MTDYEVFNKIGELITVIVSPEKYDMVGKTHIFRGGTMVVGFGSSVYDIKKIVVVECHGESGC